MDAVGSFPIDKNVSNRLSAAVFALFVGGVVACCVLCHLLNKLVTRCIPKSTALGRAQTAVNNVMRRVLASTTLHVHHGRLLVVALYLAANITLTLVNLDFSQISHAARRLGWMALCNLALTVLLALKKTPLALLLGNSHQNLNVIHRSAGFTTILLVFAHGPLFVASMAHKHRLHMLQAPKFGTAIFAAVCLLIMLATAVRCVRRGQYEMFKTLHTLFALAVLVMVGRHLYVPASSPLSHHVPFLILCCASGLWVLDRAGSFLRYVISLASDHCTITALPNGATRITFERPTALSTRAVGGHFYLWIPGVCFWGAHPFTLVSADPNPVFVVAAREGFTKRLFDLAREHPAGLRLRAAMDGPYGASCVPSIDGFDKVVLIAGGSGASFTLALALDWVRKYRDDGGGLLEKNRGLEFVWSVKKRECLAWYHEELVELQGCEAVNLSLHVTGEDAEWSKAAWPFPEDDEDLDASDGDVEKLDWEDNRSSQASQCSGAPTIRVVSGRVTSPPRERPVTPLSPPLPPQSSPLQKGVEVTVEWVGEEESYPSDLLWNLVKLSKFVLSGRPNVDDTIYAAAEHLWRGKRVLVAACGPSSLLEDARTAVTARMRWDLPEMQLYLEQFGR